MLFCVLFPRRSKQKIKESVASTRTVGKTFHPPLPAGKPCSHCLWVLLKCFMHLSLPHSSQWYILDSSHHCLLCLSTRTVCVTSLFIEEAVLASAGCSAVFLPLPTRYQRCLRLQGKAVLTDSLLYFIFSSFDGRRILLTGIFLFINK